MPVITTFLVIWVFLCIQTLYGATKSITDCGDNETFYIIESHCPKTCLDPNPMCTSMLTPRCDCKAGYLRNSVNQCVTVVQCFSNLNKTHLGQKRVINISRLIPLIDSYKCRNRSSTTEECLNDCHRKTKLPIYSKMQVCKKRCCSGNAQRSSK